MWKVHVLCLCSLNAVWPLLLLQPHQSVSLPNCHALFLICRTDRIFVVVVTLKCGELKYCYICLSQRLGKTPATFSQTTTTTNPPLSVVYYLSKKKHNFSLFIINYNIIVRWSGIKMSRSCLLHKAFQQALIWAKVQIAQVALERRRTTSDQENLQGTRDIK